ncbi:SMI1/KNR4 family protein [Variovorax sp. YR750]|uniref:SMI1/KNR4 family protein n=1 Tax=Variovorax sp. YR750 TaxID=1884384 RepID=UPI000B846A96|nr:SMI1/KNR4 family protein [Variovorax sp. YR750]
MTLDIDGLTKTVLSASRKGLLRKKPIFKPYAATSSNELSKVEQEIGTAMPCDLRDWLLAVGFGDIDDELSFRRDWLAKIESGQLKGGARFAQDVLGNFYAFDSSGCIFYLCRSEPVFAEISRNFLRFFEELIRRDYKLVDWVDALKTQKYEW